MILVSPTERPRIIHALQDAIKRLRATTGEDIPVERSSSPEKRGVDFLWRANNQWWGVQRKELHDLLASFDDGRLKLELAQMRAAVTMPHLVVEGRIAASNEGMLMTDGWGRPVSLSSLRHRMLTVQYEGVAVDYVRDVNGTASLIVDAYLWSHKANHSTAQTRPKPKSDWGRLSNKDYQMHLLQGLPEVGPKMAESIIDTLGFPLTLNATEAELQTVPGVGPATARKIVKALTNEDKT